MALLSPQRLKHHELDPIKYLVWKHSHTFRHWINYII